MVLREAGYDRDGQLQFPETVSTDYDISTRLYFEPLTFEDVMEVVEAERRSGGLLACCVQLGGQPRSSSRRASRPQGVPILRHEPRAIDLAEDRGGVRPRAARKPVCASPRTARRTTSRRPAGSPTRSATRARAPLRTCWVAAGWNGLRRGLP
ncbi:hypothetical protein QJS66_03905 [Kocuria rhizophila]|nr:hypothetical protein QJS66_03905 [Kocuria rhizophila]